MSKYETHPLNASGKCARCGNVRALKNDGTLRVHGDPYRRLMNCPGSGQPPVNEAAQ